MSKLIEQKVCIITELKNEPSYLLIKNQYQHTFSTTDSELVEELGDFLSYKVKGYFLTKEELTNLLTELTNNIVNNVKTNFDCFNWNCQGESINKQSITNELDKFLKKII